MKDRPQYQIEDGIAMPLNIYEQYENFDNSLIEAALVKRVAEPMRSITSILNELLAETNVAIHNRDDVDLDSHIRRIIERMKRRTLI